MLIRGKILSFESDLTEAFKIRKEVFVKEQGISEEEEFDLIDKEAMHVIVYEEDPNWKEINASEIREKAVATGRITFNGTVCQIGRVAVLKEYRRKKYGDFLVKMLLNKAFTAGIDEVFLNSQRSAIKFYESIGFKVEGDVFIEAGIEHYKMTIKAKDLIKTCNIH